MCIFGKVELIYSYCKPAESKLTESAASKCYCSHEKTLVNISGWFPWSEFALSHANPVTDFIKDSIP